MTPHDVKFIFIDSLHHVAKKKRDLDSCTAHPSAWHTSVQSPSTRPQRYRVKKCFRVLRIITISTKSGPQCDDKPALGNHLLLFERTDVHDVWQDLVLHLCERCVFGQGPRLLSWQGQWLTALTSTTWKKRFRSVFR